MPSRRAKSVFASVAAGFALGATTLAARYCPGAGDRDAARPRGAAEEAPATRRRADAERDAGAWAADARDVPRGARSDRSVDAARHAALDEAREVALALDEAREVALALDEAREVALALDLDPDAGPGTVRAAERPGADLERLALALGGASGVCPADMALVEGEFCGALDHACTEKNDDPAGRCNEFRRGARCKRPLDARRYCIDRFEWPNRFGEPPRVWVDWFEAKALCSAAGKRLCRRSEWMLACEGPKRLPYAWGFVRQPSPCNIDRAAIPFDEAAMFEHGDRARDDELARLWQADRIGSHPDCVSAYGVFDMAGNVDEWTDEGADDAGTSNPAALHGGYWGPVRDTCRLATRTHGPEFKFYQVGFRCCADAPGTTLPPPRPFIEPREREEDEKRKEKRAAAEPYD